MVCSVAVEVPSWLQDPYPYDHGQHTRILNQHFYIRLTGSICFILYPGLDSLVGQNYKHPSSSDFFNRLHEENHSSFFSMTTKQFGLPLSLSMLLL